MKIDYQCLAAVLYCVNRACTYKGRHNGCCQAYIGNTSNLDSNHYGGYCKSTIFDLVLLENQKTKLNNLIT